MADACTLNAGAEVVADFVLIGGGEFTTEKGSDLLGFDGMHGGSKADALEVLMDHVEAYAQHKLNQSQG